MKCPYLINEVVSKRLHKPSIIEYEADDGDNYVITAHDTTKSTLRYFADCLQEECACFYDGRCNKR